MLAKTSLLNQPTPSTFNTQMLPVWSIHLHQKVKNGHIHKGKRLGNYSLPTWSIWDRIHCTIRKKQSRHETSTKSQSQGYLFGRYTKGVSQTPRWVTNLTKKKRSRGQNVSPAAVFSLLAAQTLKPFMLLRHHFGITWAFFGIRGTLPPKKNGLFGILDEGHT